MSIFVLSLVCFGVQGAEAAGHAHSSGPGVGAGGRLGGTCSFFGARSGRGRKTRRDMLIVRAKEWAYGDYVHRPARAAGMSTRSAKEHGRRACPSFAVRTGQDLQA